MTPMRRRARRPFPFPQPGWRGTAEGECLWAAPAWTLLTGQTGRDALRWGWLSRVHGDDRAALVGMWHAAADAGQGRIDIRLLTAADQPRWHRVAIAREPGEKLWNAVATDVDDLHRRLHEQRSERAALQHRVRNTLAVIRSVARRTAENSGSVEEYRVHFDGRLAAFARTQSHILRAGDQGVDLEALLADELLANRLATGIACAGEEVRLAPRLADLFGLALHELVANAVQFGALARPGGGLDVHWGVEQGDAGRWLHLDWCETLPPGAPPLTPPDEEGFGLELLTRSLPYEVDARVEMTFAPTGLRCSVHVPVDGHRVARPCA